MTIAINFLLLLTSHIVNSMLEASWRDKSLLRIRYSAAALCYGFAWLSMVALIGMLTIADLIQGEAEAAVSGDSRDADTVARLHVVRRTHR